VTVTCLEINGVRLVSCYTKRNGMIVVLVKLLTTDPLGFGVYL